MRSNSRAGVRREGGIQDVDVDGQIDGHVSDAAPDGVDRRVDPHHVEVACANRAKPHAGVFVQVDAVVHRPADADVDRVIGNQQSLLERTPKDRAVRDRGVEVGVPGVEVCVEMDQGQRTVHAVQRTECGQRDRVVAADRHHSAFPCTDHLAHVLLDLAAGLVDVEGRHGDVSGVDDLHLLQWRHPQLDVVTGAQGSRSLSNGHGTEAGTRTVGGSAVERHSEHGDLVVGHLTDVGDPGKGRLAGVPRHHSRGNRPQGRLLGAGLGRVHRRPVGRTSTSGNAGTSNRVCR